MMELIVNGLTGILALILIVYNVCECNSQKTPVQQNWLSTGLLIQTFNMIVHLLEPDSVCNVISPYTVFISTLYVFLYSTKFCKESNKYFIKKYILSLSIFVPIVYILVNSDLIKTLEPTIKVEYIDALMTFRNIIMFIMIIVITVFNIIVILKNGKSIKFQINALFIVSCFCMVLSGMSIFLSNGILLMISKLLLIVIDIIILDTIWINKGRFYRDGR